MDPLTTHVFPLEYGWINRRIKRTCPASVAQVVSREEFLAAIDELNSVLRKYRNFHRFFYVSYFVLLGLTWLIDDLLPRILAILCLLSIYLIVFTCGGLNDIERVRNHLPTITRRFNNVLSFDLVNQKHEVLNNTNESGRNQTLGKYYLLVYSDPTAMQQAMYMPPTAIPAAHASGESTTKAPSAVLQA